MFNRSSSWRRIVLYVCDFSVYIRRALVIDLNDPTNKKASFLKAGFLTLVLQSKEVFIKI